MISLNAIACVQPAESAPLTPRVPAPDALTSVTLDTGEVLRVREAAWSGDVLVCAHPVLGTLRIPRASVKTIDVTPITPPPLASPAGTATASTTPEPSSSTEAVAERHGPLATTRSSGTADADAPPKSQPWKWSLSSGLTGTEGNTEQSAFRIDFRGERRTDRVETDLNANYRYAEDDAEASANRAELTGTRNWLFPPSRWGAFSRGKLEYDQFQEWRWRASAFAGPSYTWLKTPPTLIRSRAGLGGSYEWGGQNNGFEPEGLIGLDLEHEINERQKLSARIDYLPSLDSFPAYRIDSEAAWEIKIDPEYNLFLKIGVADRYDSTPGEERSRNDVEYFLNLGVEF